MPVGPDEDLRVVLTDAIYQEGAEHGPYERLKGPSHRVKQIETDRCAVSLLMGERVHGGTEYFDWIDYRHIILLSN
jgi:hypothetical protein